MAEEIKSLIAQPKAFTLPPTPELAAVSGQVGGIPSVSAPSPIPTPGMPGGPTFEEQRKKFKTREDVSQEEARLLQQQNELDRQIGEAEQKQKIYLAEAGSAIATQTRKEAQDIEQNLDRVRAKFPYPDFHPTQENVQSIATLFSLIGLVGVAMGGAGKMSAMNSLKSMSGMLKGWQEGRIDLWEREKSEFDKSMAKTKAILDDAYKDADRAYKTLAYNRDEAQALAGESAAKLGGQVGKQILNRQGIEKYFNYLSGVKEDFKNALEESRKKEKAELEQKQFEETKRHHKVEEGLRAKEIQQRGVRRDEKALMSLGPALRNIASQYPDGTANLLLGASPDDKKRIQGAYRAIEESESTADFVARNPKAVGALAAAKNFIRLDAIRSLQNDEAENVVNAKAALVDQGLDDAVNKRLISKDDAESAKLLQKKLFALALSDVQGSGQRGSVYLDRQFQNLYDQSSRTETLIKIIRERGEENNRNLRPYYLNVERNTNPEQFPLMESYSQDRLNKYMKDRAPVEAPVPDKVLKALSGKPEGALGEYQGTTYIVRNGKVVRK